MRAHRALGSEDPEVMVRPAREADRPALQRIDASTHSDDVSPGPAPQPGDEFFVDGTAGGQVLVAEAAGVLIGYVRIGPRYPGLSSARHVQRILGFAVAPEAQRRGVGSRLLTAAAQAARNAGARRLTLNVLATNAAARRLYQRCGFVVEGIQHAQFHLGGRYVDDVLLALDLTHGFRTGTGRYPGF